MIAQAAEAVPPTGDAPPSRVSHVTSLEEFRALRPAWDALYAADPEAQFFLSWVFLHGAFDANAGSWVVVVARDADGSVIGAMPFSRHVVWSETRRQLRNELRFGGRLFWADYGGLLCHPAHEEEAVAAIAGELQRMAWAKLVLKGFRASPRRFGLFIGAFVDERFTIGARADTINDGATDNLVCPSIDLPADFEAYLRERLSANSREQLRRALRRSEGTPGIRLSVAGAADRDAHVAALEKLWSASWRDRKGAETSRLAAQYGRIAARGIDDGTMRLSVLWRDDAPIAAIGTFVDRVKRELLFFVAGRDPDHSAFDAGKVMHANEIRWAISQGLRRYDLLRGNEFYKYRLGAADTRIRYAVVATETGTNLGGRLDPATLDDAMRITDGFARAGRSDRARTSCRQILAAAPEHPDALALLARVTRDE